MYERNNVLELRCTGISVNDAGNKWLGVPASNGRLEQERRD